MGITRPRPDGGVKTKENSHPLKGQLYAYAANDSTLISQDLVI